MQQNQQARMGVEVSETRLQALHVCSCSCQLAAAAAAAGQQQQAASSSSSSNALCSNLLVIIDL